MRKVFPNEGLFICHPGISVFKKENIKNGVGGQTFGLPAQLATECRRHDLSSTPKGHRYTGEGFRRRCLGRWITPDWIFVSGVTLRNLHFCLHGLKEVQSELSSLKIGFQLVRGWERGGEERAGAVLGQFIQEKHPQACVVTDFSPFRIHRGIANESTEQKFTLFFCT